MVKSKIFAVLVLVFCLQSTAFAHDFFISITTLSYNKNTNSFEVEMKVTAHDFEKAIQKKYKQELKLTSKNEHKDADKLINDYLVSQFKVWINGAVIKPNYVGKEVHLDENMFIYFELKCPDIVHTITLKNMILIDYFPIQENITHLLFLEKKWSYTFTKNQSEKTFSIK